MQDRFRYRVYLKYNQGMWNIDSYCFLQGLDKCVLHFTENRQKTLKNDDFILMQCTGLKDKNGKLIYELDHIKYQNNEYKVEIDKFFGISLTNILNGDIIVMDDIVLFNCEVIGNEFESNTKI